jgi:ABC-type multidrug transport system, permease component
MLKYLIEKEFKQIMRNAFLPKLVIMFPIVAISVFPWAANMDVKDIRFVTVDHDNSTFSSRLTGKIAGSGFFVEKGRCASYEEALYSIEHGDADIAIEIPEGFEKGIVNDNHADLFIASNAVDGIRGALAASHMAAITQQFSEELNREQGSSYDKNIAVVPKIEAAPRVMYNPSMDYKHFMVPAIMVMLLTIIGGFLPALNIVMEKEKGTIEQINVSPVGRFTFILSKLIPYWIIGFIVLSLCILFAWIIYGIVPVGRLYNFYLLASLFLLVVSGFGLIISNHSGTMQQAMFVMFFFLLIMVMMSGLFTPIASMPDWALFITHFNPLRYFVEIMRMLFLKGSSLGALTYQISALAGFAVVFNLWAVISYRKNG